jgi:hypothetical protein
LQGRLALEGTGLLAFPDGLDLVAAGVGVGVIFTHDFSAGLLLGFEGCGWVSSRADSPVPDLESLSLSTEMFCCEQDWIELKGMRKLEQDGPRYEEVAMLLDKAASNVTSSLSGLNCLNTMQLSRNVKHHSVTMKGPETLMKPQ